MAAIHSLEIIQFKRVLTSSSLVIGMFMMEMHIWKVINISAQCKANGQWWETFKGPKVFKHRHKTLLPGTSGCCTFDMNDEYTSAFMYLERWQSVLTNQNFIQGCFGTDGDTLLHLKRNLCPNQLFCISLFLESMCCILIMKRKDV